MLDLPVLLILFLTPKEFTVDVGVGPVRVSQLCHQIVVFGEKSVCVYIVKRNKQAKKS